MLLFKLSPFKSKNIKINFFLNLLFFTIIKNRSLRWGGYRIRSIFYYCLANMLRRVSGKTFVLDFNWSLVIQTRVINFLLWFHSFNFWNVIFNDITISTISSTYNYPRIRPNRNNLNLLFSFWRLISALYLI